MQIDYNDFIAFCEERGNVEYNYVDGHDCAFSQYLKDRNICKNPLVCTTMWLDFDNLENNYYNYIPEEFNDALKGKDGANKDKNFMLLAERVRELV